jgi:hypothetical protein
MSCILRAGGNSFNVDDFIGKTSLVADSVWRRGEKRFPTSTTNKTIKDSSGIRVIVSKADFCELSKQIEDTISFLRKNYDDLKKLNSFPGVEGTEIDFGAEISPPFWASFTFPPELLMLAGSVDISLRLSVYPTVNEASTNI